MGINKGASRCMGIKTPSGVLIKPASNGFQSPKERHGDDEGPWQFVASVCFLQQSYQVVLGFERQSAGLGVKDSTCIRQQSLLPPRPPVFVSGHCLASRKRLFDFCCPPSFSLCNILVFPETLKLHPFAPQPTPTSKIQAIELNHGHMEINIASLSHRAAGIWGPPLLLPMPAGCWALAALHCANLGRRAAPLWYKAAGVRSNCSGQ